MIEEVVIQVSEINNINCQGHKKKSNNIQWANVEN